MSEPDVPYDTYIVRVWATDDEDSDYLYSWTDALEKRLKMFLDEEAAACAYPCRITSVRKDDDD